MRRQEARPLAPLHPPFPGPSCELTFGLFALVLLRALGRPNAFPRCAFVLWRTPLAIRGEGGGVSGGARSQSAVLLFALSQRQSRRAPLALLHSPAPKMAVDRSPPPPRGPRISLDIADAPTQRLYLFSALVLLSAWKLSEFLFPSASPAVDEFNWKLARWVVVDLAFVAAVAGLRVPRLDWGWKGRMATRALLLLVDWLLFGRWEVSNCSLGNCVG